jgi:hypothetical protein
MKCSISKPSTTISTPPVTQSSEPSSNTKKRKRTETEQHSQANKAAKRQKDGQVKDKAPKRAKGSAGELTSPSVPKQRKSAGAKTSSFVAIKKDLIEPQTPSSTKTKTNMGIIDLTNEATDDEDSELEQPEVPKARKAKKVNKEQAKTKEQPVIDCPNGFDWRKAQAQLKQALSIPNKPVTIPQHPQSRAVQDTNSESGVAKPETGTPVLKNTPETPSNQPDDGPKSDKINKHVSSPCKTSTGSASQKSSGQQKPKKRGSHSSSPDDTSRQPVGEVLVQYQVRAADASNPVTSQQAPSRLPRVVTACPTTPLVETEDQLASERSAIESKRFSDMQDGQGSHRSRAEAQRLHDAEQIKLSMAKNKFEVLQAEDAGFGAAKDIIYKRILVHKCKMQLAQIEVDRLYASIADREAATSG